VTLFSFVDGAELANIAGKLRRSSRCRLLALACANPPGNTVRIGTRRRLPAPPARSGAVMQLSGQYSNPSGPLKAALESLSDPRPECAPRPEYATAVSGRPAPPRLRWGAIQAAVVEVLSEVAMPMRVWDVHAAVEKRLRLDVSYHTVCSFLIAAARSPSCGVERVR